MWSIHAPNCSRFILTNLEVINSSVQDFVQPDLISTDCKCFGRRLLSMREKCTQHTHCDTFSLKICIFQQFPFVRSHFSILDGPLVFYWSNNVKRCICILNLLTDNRDISFDTFEWVIVGAKVEDMLTVDNR